MVAILHYWQKNQEAEFMNLLAVLLNIIAANRYEEKYFLLTIGLLLF
jgi:hypothetical protein